MKSEIQKPILVISASDSSAAAGMQMDLRVLNDLGVPARCAVTAVTVQGDSGARIIQALDQETILASITTALSDSPGIGAAKVGLLGDPATAELLERTLSVIISSGVPVVVDPVMRSTPGSALSEEGTATAISEKILPWTSLITPNRDELDTLAGLAGENGDDEPGKASRLMASGAGAVLVTGGDTHEDQCTDILYGQEGLREIFRHPRIGNRAPRGTGCALSTSIAVHLAGGLEMTDAVRRSIDYVTGLIEGAVVVGEQLLLLPGKR